MPQKKPIYWDACNKFTRNEAQSMSSFNEQKFAIKICVLTIDKYCNWLELDTYTKNMCIRGFPGSGKTWCSLYCALHALSKGLNVITTAVLAKRAIQSGGIHYHKLFCLRI